MKTKNEETGSEKKIKIPNSTKGRAVIGVAIFIIGLLVAFVIAPMVNGSTVKAATAKVINTKTSSTKESDYKLNDGQYLLSVSTKNFCDSVSGKLRSGDIATVFIPPTSTGGNAVTNAVSVTAAENPPELQYVKVVAVTTASGQDTNGSIQNNSSNTSNNQPATVTLLVNVKQAAILAGTEQNTVHFALAYRGGGDKANELLKKQEEYFNTSQNKLQNTSDSQPQTSKATSSQTEIKDDTVTVEVSK